MDIYPFQSIFSNPIHDCNSNLTDNTAFSFNNGSNNNSNTIPFASLLNSFGRSESLTNDTASNQLDLNDINNNNNNNDDNNNDSNVRMNDESTIQLSIAAEIEAILKESEEEASRQ